jgi:hypothetical protein
MGAPTITSIQATIMKRLLPLVLAIAFLLFPGSVLAVEEDGDLLIPPPVFPKGFRQCTEVNDINSAGGYSNTCYSVFGASSDPERKRFSFIPLGWSPKTALVCYRGAKFTTGSVTFSACDNPPVCKTIQPSGNPAETPCDITT